MERLDPVPTITIVHLSSASLLQWTIFLLGQSGLYKGLLANRGGGEIAATSMYPLIYPDERLFMHAEPIFCTPRFALRNLTKIWTGGKRLSTWSLVRQQRYCYYIEVNSGDMSHPIGPGIRFSVPFMCGIPTSTKIVLIYLLEPQPLVLGSGFQPITNRSECNLM
jgi:hypothetical protein